MKSTPDFLSLDDILLIHEEQLARYHGGSGIRDVGALDSAVATPRATFDGELLHTDLFEIAAAYAFHIGQNQPFVDGNKRTGLAAALVFLDINDVEVADPDGRLYQAMTDVAERSLDKRGLAELLRELAVAK